MRLGLGGETAVLGSFAVVLIVAAGASLPGTPASTLFAIPHANSNGLPSDPLNASALYSPGFAATCDPLAVTVSFSGNARGGVSPYEFSWDFGDHGALSSTQNPTHTYHNASTYNVTLVVSDSVRNRAITNLTVSIGVPSCATSFLIPWWQFAAVIVGFALVTAIVSLAAVRWRRS